MALFSKRMALEFKFYYEILKIGLVAKASKQQLKLPQATAWTQSSTVTFLVRTCINNSRDSV